MYRDGKASRSVINKINLRKFIHYIFCEFPPFTSDFWISPQQTPHGVLACGFLFVPRPSTQLVARGADVSWTHAVSMAPTLPPLIPNVLTVRLPIGGAHQIFLRCGGDCIRPPRLSRYYPVQIRLHFS